MSLTAAEIAQPVKALSVSITLYSVLALPSQVPMAWFYSLAMFQTSYWLPYYLLFVVIIIIACVCVCVSKRTMILRSKDHLQKAVLSFHHVDSRNLTPVIRLSVWRTSFTHEVLVVTTCASVLTSPSSKSSLNAVTSLIPRYCSATYVYKPTTAKWGCMERQGKYRNTGRKMSPSPGVW